MKRNFIFEAKKCTFHCDFGDWYLLPSIRIVKVFHPLITYFSEMCEPKVVKAYSRLDFYISFLCFTFYWETWGKVKEKKK